ncbi:DEKNAAC100637 [Brettanomyces naardenensis]|uniref:DEKNAAC100637 n=1 Tax=Brettanomyces naardenensis TaxID=13370 RepID=A0A448YF86_BRENA|nr:DEKNAAC100637 [Brettanomyces naardenensis]
MSESDNRQTPFTPQMEDDLGSYLEHLDVNLGKLSGLQQNSNGRTVQSTTITTDKDLDELFDFVSSMDDPESSVGKQVKSTQANGSAPQIHIDPPAHHPPAGIPRFEFNEDEVQDIAIDQRDLETSLQGDQFLRPQENVGNSNGNVYSDLSASTSPYLSAAESPFRDDDESSSLQKGLNMDFSKDEADILFSHTIEQLSLEPATESEAVVTTGATQPLTVSNLHQQQQQQQLQQLEDVQELDLLQSPYDAPSNENNVLGDPEKVAAKTPSLFSRSPSRCSSSSNNNNNNLQERPTIHVEDTSGGLGDQPDSSKGTAGSILSPSLITDDQIKETYSYLSVPEDKVHDSMRLGRQRRNSESSGKGSHSRSSSVSRSSSRSRSSNYEETTDENGHVTYKLSREKLSDLAAPSLGKKNQKNPSLYACTICDKKFTRPYNLKSHLRTHTNERPFVCSICGKAFARQHDKKRHEDLHSGEKRFQCRGTLADGVTVWGCGKRFARTDALRRHFQTESGKECIRPLLDEISHDTNINSGANSSYDYDFDPIAAAMQNAQEAQRRSSK